MPGGRDVLPDRLACAYRRRGVKFTTNQAVGPQVAAFVNCAHLHCCLDGSKLKGLLIAYADCP